MAAKTSTLILSVDLECHRCYKKIRKTLCKLQIQDRENIQTISFDEKNNKVTISGPFDPKKLSKKLCCNASKVIKDIKIVVEPKEKEKEKPKEKEKEKEKEKPKEAKPANKEKEKPKETKPAEKEKPKTPTEPVKDKAQAEPAKLKPAQEDPKPTSGVVMGPGPAYPPAWQTGPVCHCGPWYEAHYGGCRCWACGRTYGWVSEGPPHDGNRTCHFFSDEDPNSSCSVM